VRATTIRFTPELSAELEREATREGVSVAQYVRDSVLFRLTYTARAREESAGRQRTAGRFELGDGARGAPLRMTSSRF
jgi:hypothetical protein